MTVRFIGEPLGHGSNDMRCSFCDKSDAEVRKLVAGPDAFICNECVDLCVVIMRGGDDDAPPLELWPDSPSVAPTATAACTLCHLPGVRDEALLVPGRGLLCAGCLGEIEAALAAKRLGPE